MDDKCYLEWSAYTACVLHEPPIRASTRSISGQRRQLRELFGHLHEIIWIDKKVSLTLDLGEVGLVGCDEDDAGLPHAVAAAVGLVPVLGLDQQMLLLSTSHPCTTRYITHRIRIETEEKAKVAAACLVGRIDSIPCHASYFLPGWYEDLDELHQDDMKNRINSSLSSWCKIAGMKRI